MIGVVSRVEVAAGQNGAFERRFRDLKAKVHANIAGALFYGLVRTGVDAYAVYEFYVDRAALDAHRAAAYFKPAMAGVASCLAGPPETEYLDMVA